MLEASASRSGCEAGSQAQGFSSELFGERESPSFPRINDESQAVMVEEWSERKYLFCEAETL